MNVRIIKDNKAQHKMFLLLFLVFLFVIVIVGGYTIAFMVAPTQAKLNNANVGDIEARLTESDWDKLGDSEKILYPNKSLPKNPVVENISDRNHDIYAYIKVRIPRAEVVVVSNKTTVADPVMTNLFTYNFDTVHWIEIEKLSPVENTPYAEAVYGYYTKLEKDQTTEPLFETVTFVNILEGSLPKGTKLEIEIESLAIQADYLDEVEGEQEQDLIKHAYGTYLK